MRDAFWLLVFAVRELVFSRNIYVDVLVFLDEWSMGIVNFLFKVGVKYMPCVPAYFVRYIVA